MFKTKVGPGQGGVTLERHLRRALPDVSLSSLHRLLRTKQVRVNGKRVSDPRFVLTAGDEAVVFLDDVGEPRPSAVRRTDRAAAFRVVFEDESMLVADKPSGLPVHDEKGADNLDEQVWSYLVRKGEYDPKNGGFAPCHVHRIDAPTSGLVVYAKTRAAAADLGAALKTHDRFVKFYAARVHGKLSRTMRVEGYIHKDPTHVNRMVFTQGKQVPGAKHAVTLIAPGDYDPATDTTAIRLQPLTGRKHQLRAVCAHLGHPIVGDERYGSSVKGELALVAERIVVDGREFVR